MSAKAKSKSVSRDPVTGRLVVKVSKAERAAARLQMTIDQSEGRATPPHIKAIAEAKPAAKSA